MPVGLVLVASVTVVWDFATSGLEMGLVWLWLAASWWVLVTVARDTTDHGASPHRVRGGPRARAARPARARRDDGVLHRRVVCARRARAGWCSTSSRCSRCPSRYEIFRMGYYATIVPNTALAKDAGGLHVGQGWDYATDFVTPYRLWAAAALIVVVVAIRLAAQHDRRITIVTVAMLAAALLESAYIVAIGGDYMHGRLLLPAFFALGLPASVSLGRLRAPLPLRSLAVVSPVRDLGVGDHGVVPPAHARAGRRVGTGADRRLANRVGRAHRADRRRARSQRQRGAGALQTGCPGLLPGRRQDAAPAEGSRRVRAHARIDRRARVPRGPQRLGHRHRRPGRAARGAHRADARPAGRSPQAGRSRVVRRALRRRRAPIPRSSRHGTRSRATPAPGCWSRSTATSRPGASSRTSGTVSATPS